MSRITVMVAITSTWVRFLPCGPFKIDMCGLLAQLVRAVDLRT